MHNKSGMKYGGVFRCEHWRDGKMIGETEGRNLVTNQGVNKALDSVLHNDNEPTWYVCIFDTNTTTASDDTHAVPAYTENTEYDEAARPEYLEGAAVAKEITNGNKATFTMNANATIYGAAVVSAATKGSTAAGDFLFCGAKFAAVRYVVDDDLLKITYTLSGDDDGV